MMTVLKQVIDKVLCAAGRFGKIILYNIIILHHFTQMNYFLVCGIFKPCVRCILYLL